MQFHAEKKTTRVRTPKSAANAVLDSKGNIHRVSTPAFFLNPEFALGLEGPPAAQVTWLRRKML